MNLLWIDIDETKDVTVKAVHTVAFDALGGSPTPDDQEVVDGEYANKPGTDPEKDEFAFIYWTESNCCAETSANSTEPPEFIFDSTPIEEDITLYAYYKETHIVTFIETGDDAISPQEVIDGEKAEKPDPDPEKDDYRFRYWKLVVAPVQSTTFVQEFDFNTPITEDITLEGIWKREYKVEFNTVGGSPQPDDQYILEGKFAKKPIPDPTKNNFAFQYWYEARQNGGDVISDSTPHDEFIFDEEPILRDTKLNAYWKKALTVTFDANGGNPTPVPQTVVKGDYAEKPNTDPDKTGFEFQYWTRANLNPTAYVAEDFEADGRPREFKFSTTKIMHSLTLYAYYKPVHTVSFDINGGNPPAPDDQLVVHGQKATKPADPTRNGYRFKYWQEVHIRPVEINPDVIAESAEFNFNKKIKHDTLLIARWKKTYVVSFDSDGGDYTPDDQIVDKNGNATKPVPDPFKYGHTFKYWEEVVEVYTLPAPPVEGFDFEHTPITHNTQLIAIYELAPNFWVTVDDYHDVYFNGSLLTNPDEKWQTVDAHIVTVERRNLIAVKGWDKGKYSATYPNGGTRAYQGPGMATISGFIASLDRGEGEERLETDGSWWYTLTEPQDNKWRNKFNYEPPEDEIWYHVYDITAIGNPGNNWPSVGTAHYIWSPDYYQEPFDSPVWFRNVRVKTPEAFEVTFDINDDGTGEAGPVPGTQYIANGDKADVPEEPTWPGRSFQYWEEQEAEVNALEEDPGFDFNTKIHFDTHLKAIWEENEEVTVYFNPDNGESVFTETFLGGLSVDKPVPDPVKDGYTFKYWDYDYENMALNGYTGYNFGLPVEYDLYLIAIYDKIPEYFDVTFDINDDGTGEAGPVPETQSVLEGNKADEPTDPTWPGRTFQYWEEEIISVRVTPIIEPGFDFNTPIYHNTHLKAIWEDNKEVTVYFNPDNTNATFTETLLSGQSVDQPIPDPEKYGYEFKYWDYDYEYMDTVATFVYTGYNFELPVEYDLYLIAIYDKIPEYLVTFDADGGLPVPSNETVLEGTKVPVPTSPSKSGWTFSHWKEIEYSNGEETYYQPDAMVIVLQDPFDFDTLIYHDTALLAVYDEVTVRKTYSPNAVKDYLATDMNVPVKVKTSVLMSNDSHANNFVSVQKPSNGTVKLSGTTVTFTPDVDFAGSAKFYYTIEYKGKKDEGLVVVQVNAVIIEEETPLGASNRYIVGYPKGSFESFNPLTRAELATMYARLLSLNYQAKTIPQYTDVISTSWYAPYINILKQTEILVGYADNTFNPDGLITRAELASSIARYYEFVGEEFTATPSGFTDIEGHPAQSDIEIVVAQEMMSAYTGTSFMPDRLITRVETIKVLNKLFGIQPRVPQKPSFNDINSKSFGFTDIEAATEDTIFTAK
jgi:hypothetical protein